MWSPPRPSVEWIVIAAIAAIYKIAANTPVIAFLVMSGRRQWQRCPCRRHDLRHRHWQPEVAPPIEEEEIVSLSSKERKMAEWMKNEMMGVGEVDHGGDHKDSGGEPNKGSGCGDDDNDD